MISEDPVVLFSAQAELHKIIHSSEDLRFIIDSITKFASVHYINSGWLSGSTSLIVSMAMRHYNHGRAEIMTAVLECGANTHLEASLKWAFTRENRGYINVLLRFGVPLPKRIYGDSTYGMLLRRVTRTANYSRDAALTILLIKQRNASGSVFRIVDKPVVKMIAKMVYESGLFEWEDWE